MQAQPAREVLTLKRAQFGLGVLISLVAFYLALRNVHWSAVGQAIREANYAYVALAFGLLAFTFVLRALRWRLLLQPLPHARLWHLFGALNVAYFINNVLPLQMGDLGRAYLLSELEGISTTRSLATVVVERVLDVLTLLLFLLCLTPFIDIPAWARAPSIIFAVGASALTIGLIGASLHRAFVLGLIEKALRLAPRTARPKLLTMAGSAIEGFEALTRPVEAVRLLAFSVAIWLVAGASVYLVMLAFRLGTGYDAALFVLIATTFGFFVPSSPGAFGVYDAIAIGTLTSVFGIEKNLAVSYALVVHLVFYLPPMLFGPLFLWRERAVWRQRPSLFGKLAELRGLPEAE